MKKTVRTALFCVIACILAITGAFSIAPPTLAAAATEGAQAAADPITTGTWKDWGLDDTTQNVGRIWTDKSVSAGDIDLTGAGGTTTIQKGDSDFLTAFSALSSTSNLRDTVTTPLDIVLVLDASGSMSDPMGGSDRTKRIDALKAAANSFIDKIAESNGKIADESLRHNVSIVKFSGKKSDIIGNQTYRSGGYTYNYSQIMKNMTTVDSAGAKSLKETVNSISPAGSTRADYGLELASSQLANHGRAGATKVVVFFTDGAPTSTNGFEGGVANSAVSAAKSMKDAGTTIYTIGIFSGANPAGGERENFFMNAVSSNYPKATAYNNLGDRVSGAAYYKTATTSGDLKTLFESISQEILESSGYPTEVRDGFENESGYVTFTDQLGDYMKVDDFRAIVFANQVFSAHTKTTSGNIDTYTFSGSAQTALYPAGDLSSIVIEVRRAKDARTGDHVTVKIPASLIPLRAFSVDAEKGTGSATLTFPIRVFFGSSLKDEVANLLANPDADMTDYLANHKAADGRVEFLANAWSGDADGNACASFTPAASNGYYYIREDTPVYEDEALTARAAYPLQGGKTYYYGRTYWDLAGDGSAAQERFVASLSLGDGGVGSYVGADASGKAYIKSGAPRFAYINELHTQKANNVTATAASFINPVWAGTQILTWLGNNGKLTLERPGSLEISKVVELAHGYDAADFANEQFEFTASISAAAGKSFTGTVTLGDVVQGDENFSLTFDEDGEYTHALKPGEKLTIKGLIGGWAYKVEETARDGWTTAAVGAEGTISAGEAAEVEFENTYGASGVLEGETGLAGTKALDGRAWRSEDKFAFVLAAEDDAPMPEGAQDGVAVMYVTAPEGTPDGTKIPFNFGDITYTRPGTYAYTITEVGADSGYDVGILGGVSVSKATYRVTVKVTDEAHDGELTVAATMERLVDDAGNKVGENDHGEAVDFASFRNVYEIADADYAGITVSKVLNGRAMAAGEFSFTITGTDDASVALLAESDRSFANGAAASGEKNSMTKLNGLIFTKTDAGKTYTFTVKEAVPEGTDKLGGVTYDEREHTVEISVADGGYGTLKVTTKVDGQEGNEVEFENAYAVAPLETELDFGLAKRLEGRDWMDSDAFTFEITAATDGAPMPISTTTTVTRRDLRDDGTAAIRFGKIRFIAAGTYEYEVREQKADAAENGMTYSTNVARIRVTVVDNGAGSLVATPALVFGSSVFVNSYGVDLDYNAKGGLSITKELVGASAAEGVFSFTVAAEGDDVLGIAGTYPSPWLTEGDAGLVAATTSEVVFTPADDGKTWNYTVTEKDPGTGFTCDCATWNIAVSVAYDSSVGRLSVTTTATGGDSSRTWTYTSDGDGAAPAVVKFVNRYAASGATADIYGTKELKGRQMADGEFSFELAYAAQPDTVVARAQNVAGGVDFGALSYTTDGLATLVEAGTAAKTDTGWSVGYVAREVTDGLSGIGITPRASSFGVTVNIVDAGNGTLTCSVEYPEGGLAFKNEYQTTTATIGLTATKTLAVPDGLAGPGDIAGKFTFTVTGEEGAPTPEYPTATNDASGTVNFGNITFTLENTFGGAVATADEEPGSEVDEADALAAEVKETDRSGAAEGNVLLDTPVVSENDSADVGKKDNGQTVADEPDDAAEPNVEPEGQAEPEAPLADTPVVKEVPAESVEPEASVARWVYRRGNALRRASAELDAEVDADAPTDESTGPRSRVFHYVVTESGSLSGVTNDPRASRDVYIKVTDDGAGHLSAEIVKPVDLTFTNSYGVSATSATINARKVLEGRDLAAGEFEFALLDADGKTVRTAKNDANGSVTFDAIEYSAPGAYTYTIAEVGGNAGGVKYDGSRHEVKVTVTDNRAGALSADVEYVDAPTFVNTYKAQPVDVGIVAKKVLNGTNLTKGQFTFALKGTVNDEPVERSAANDADGNVVFPHLEFESAGTYTFTVSEVAGDEARVTYDKRVFTVAVEVTDDGSGKLSATVANDAPEGAMVFVNTYTPPATPPANPPATPTTPTTTVKTKTTARPVPQTGDASVGAAVPIAAATVGLALLGMAARTARRRAES
mgnify:FL=1